MAVTPGLRAAAVPKEYIRPITDAFYKHYKRVAGVLLVILLFTGGINVHFVNQILISQTGHALQYHPKYLWIFCIKLILVLGLLTLFLYSVIFKRDPDEEEETEVYESIPFQRAALWMGFFIILCAAAMKHLHQ